jgi:hypothetical protein
VASAKTLFSFYVPSFWYIFHLQVFELIIYCGPLAFLVAVCAYFLTAYPCVPTLSNLPLQCLSFSPCALKLSCMYRRGSSEPEKYRARESHRGESLLVYIMRDTSIITATSYLRGTYSSQVVQFFECFG